MVGVVKVCVEFVLECDSKEVSLVQRPVTECATATRHLMRGFTSSWVVFGRELMREPVRVGHAALCRLPTGSLVFER